jgi:acetyl esterase/lipase
MSANGKPLDSYVYKTIGDRQLSVEMDIPDDWRPGDKRPAIVFFFGGGWSGGSPIQFKPQAEYLAKRGMVCARVDYRVKGTDGVLPDKCVEDARSAMRWVRANAKSLGIDPDRIVSSGGSAGGHLAACTFFSEDVNDPNDDMSVSPKPNAMILYNPALDFTADQLKEKYGGKLADDMFLKISPTPLMTKDTVPTLLVDGTEDFLYGQIKAFETKGKELGAPVEAYYCEDQTHGFFNRPPWLQKTTQRADEFLQSLGYLGAEPRVELPTKEAPRADGAKVPSRNR